MLTDLNPIGMTRTCNLEYQSEWPCPFGNTRCDSMLSHRHMLGSGLGAQLQNATRHTTVLHCGTKPMGT